MNFQKISKQLFEAYRDSGKSYGDLEKETGIPKTMIMRYLTGSVARIPIDRLDALCRALGLNAKELLGWKDPEPGVVLSPRQKVLLDASDELTDSEHEMLMDIIASIRKRRN